MEVYKSCNRCVMDTSDPNISLDDDGQCDYCANFDKNISPNWNTTNSGL